MAGLATSKKMIVDVGRKKKTAAHEKASSTLPLEGQANRMFLLSSARSVSRSGEEEAARDVHLRISQEQVPPDGLEWSRLSSWFEEGSEVALYNALLWQGSAK